MDETLPNAKSAADPYERAQVQRIISQRGLGGLANDTKWNELISAMRSRKDWCPGYRFKCIDGPPSRWDVEWFYHLPFPFIAVEWLDIGRLQEITEHRLPPRKHIIDHATWIEPLLLKIGLDYRMGAELVRVFGYYPRNLDLFDQWATTP
jgi:hypothetical protein